MSDESQVRPLDGTSPGHTDPEHVEGDAHFEHGPGSGLATAVADPVADPGLPAHLPRPTDVNPVAERRAERQVAGLFVLSAVFTVLFCVSYFVFSIGGSGTSFLGLGMSTVALGVCFGAALLCVGIGAIQWARKLMTDEEIVEMRHPAESSKEDREETVAALLKGAEESGIARRPLIRNSLLGATAFLGVPAILVLRDLGPLPGDKLEHTVWKKGMRVVRDVAGTPIKDSDLEVGDLVNAEPGVFFEKNSQGEPEVEGVELQQEKAKAAVILVRMQPQEIHPSKGRANWGVNGILCYSKICTHVGCPISLYEQQTHHLLCPCHQSTFDLADNGKVVFGPAGHSLPQLPIALDSEGYLVATSDFTEPVGPSYWTRG